MFLSFYWCLLTASDVDTQSKELPTQQCVLKASPYMASKRHLLIVSVVIIAAVGRKFRVEMLTSPGLDPWFCCLSGHRRGVKGAYEIASRGHQAQYCLWFIQTAMRLYMTCSPINYYHNFKSKNHIR